MAKSPAGAASRPQLPYRQIFRLVPGGGRTPTRGKPRRILRPLPHHFPAPVFSTVCVSFRHSHKYLHDSTQACQIMRKPAQLCSLYFDFYFDTVALKLWKLNRIKALREFGRRFTCACSDSGTEQRILIEIEKRRLVSDHNL